MIHEVISLYMIVIPDRFQKSKNGEFDIEDKVHSWRVKLYEHGKFDQSWRKVYAERKKNCTEQTMSQK